MSSQVGLAEPVPCRAVGSSTHQSTFSRRSKCLILSQNERTDWVDRRSAETGLAEDFLDRQLLYLVTDRPGITIQGARSLERVFSNCAEVVKCECVLDFLCSDSATANTFFAGINELEVREMYRRNVSMGNIFTRIITFEQGRPR
jgi:hypothetical protein